MFQQRPLPAVKLTDINTIKSVFILVSDDASFYTPAFSLYNSFLHIIACTICHLKNQLQLDKIKESSSTREGGGKGYKGYLTVYSLCCFWKCSNKQLQFQEIDNYEKAWSKKSTFSQGFW